MFGVMDSDIPAILKLNIVECNGIQLISYEGRMPCIMIDIEERPAQLVHYVTYLTQKYPKN